MSSTQTSPSTVTEVPLEAITVGEGFNPRDRVDTELVASIARHGVLQPLLVSDVGDGAFRLIDGERRFRAATEAGLKSVPVHVREPGESDGLSKALIANIARADLNPLEEARGFARLLDGGLTRKGAAEELTVSERRVRERLSLLELPEALHAKIADGTIPPGAFRALVTLAKVAPGLAELGVKRVLGAPKQEWDDPITWTDLASDPIAVVSPTYEGDERDLPAGVYDVNAHYEASAFSLGEKAAKDLLKLTELLGSEPRVRFDRDAVDTAEKLGGVVRSTQGWSALIVGQDIADQLAGDYISRCLKVQRDNARRHSEHAAQTTGDSGSPQSEEEVKAQRAREREAEREARVSAHAFNVELGAAVVDRLSRVRLDERVLKVLVTFALKDELDGLARRGARYGFPGWPAEATRKNGSTKVSYPEPHEVHKKAKEYLDGAKTAGEIAGRAVALIAMAHMADEEAIARSNRSFYSVRPGSSSPWAKEALALVEELCAERLPEPLIKDARKRRPKH